MQKVNSQEESLIKLMDGISDIESTKNGVVAESIKWRRSDDDQDT